MHCADITTMMLSVAKSRATNAGAASCMIDVDTGTATACANEAHGYPLPERDLMTWVPPAICPGGRLDLNEIGTAELLATINRMRTGAA